MKYYCWPVLIVIFLLTACTKEQLIKPYAHIDLKVVDSKEEFTWEQIDGSWKVEEKAATLYAMTDQQSQFIIQLKNISDTGLVPSLTIEQINFYDAISFRPNRLINGFVKITNIKSTELQGEFDVELESNYHQFETRRFKGKFGIVD